MTEPEKRYPGAQIVQSTDQATHAVMLFFAGLYAGR